MERYTYFENGKWRVCVGDTEYSGPWVDRLAAYEDTGLEPDGIDEALNEAHDLGYQACLNYKGSTWSEAAELQAYRALGTVEELTALVKAQDEGRAILPRVSERDKKGMADFLHDCFADWTHDPSVGLYGMTEGEAILANAIMDALTRAEAEAALGGGGDGL